MLVVFSVSWKHNAQRWCKKKKRLKNKKTTNKKTQIGQKERENALSAHFVSTILSRSRHRHQTKLEIRRPSSSTGHVLGASVQQQEAKGISSGSPNKTKNQQPFLNTPEFIGRITDLQNSKQFQIHWANFKTIIMQKGGGSLRTYCCSQSFWTQSPHR